MSEFVLYAFSVVSFYVPQETIWVEVIKVLVLIKAMVAFPVLLQESVPFLFQGSILFPFHQISLSLFWKPLLFLIPGSSWNLYSLLNSNFCQIRKGSIQLFHSCVFFLFLLQELMLPRVILLPFIQPF